MVCHFGTVEHDDWDLDRCPVPIRLSQVKTDMAYTTFIDRDTVSYLRDYLRWVELESGGRPDPPGPLFTTRRGTPVSADWVSERFNRPASNAGIQKRIRPGVLGIHSHSVRHLLKSALLVAGCAPYAADHILGHSPRDSYGRQAVLYPEAVRREYAEASALLNVFMRVERHLDHLEDGGPDDSPVEEGRRRPSKPEKARRT